MKADDCVGVDGAEEVTTTADAVDGPLASEQGPLPQTTRSFSVSVMLEFASLPTTALRFSTAEASARREKAQRKKISRPFIAEISSELKVY